MSVTIVLDYDFNDPMEPEGFYRVMTSPIERRNLRDGDEVIVRDDDGTLQRRGVLIGCSSSGEVFVKPSGDFEYLEGQTA